MIITSIFGLIILGTMIAFKLPFIFTILMGLAIVGDVFAIKDITRRDGRLS